MEEIKFEGVEMNSPQLLLKGPGPVRVTILDKSLGEYVKKDEAILDLHEISHALKAVITKKETITFSPPPLKRQKMKPNKGEKTYAIGDVLELALDGRKDRRFYQLCGVGNYEIGLINTVSGRILCASDDTDRIYVKDIQKIPERGIKEIAGFTDFWLRDDKEKVFRLMPRERSFKMGDRIVSGKEYILACVGPGMRMGLINAETGARLNGEAVCVTDIMKVPGSAVDAMIRGKYYKKHPRSVEADCTIRDYENGKTYNFYRANYNGVLVLASEAKSLVQFDAWRVKPEFISKAIGTDNWEVISS